MASNPSGSKKTFVETGTEPEFFVTDIRLEAVAGGNIRLYAYAERGDRELHLLYTAVMPADTALTNGRLLMHGGADAHNLAIWKDEDGSSRH